MGGGVLAIGVLGEDGLPPGEEDVLPWGVDVCVAVAIVVGVSEARFLAALMRTFTVDGIFSVVPRA